MVARIGSRLDHGHIDQRNAERHAVRLAHGPSVILWLTMPIDEKAESVSLNFVNLEEHYEVLQRRAYYTNERFNSTK